MTTQQLRELDAWHAEFVMRYRKVERWQELVAGSETFWIHPQDGLVLSPAKFSHLMRRFRPTTNPADSMALLKKCAEKVDQISITHCGTWAVCEGDGNHTEPVAEAEAETLELAIALFAKQLYETRKE